MPKITCNTWPVFGIDPFFFRNNRETCDDRIIFMFECLNDLNKQYNELGTKLNILYGNSVEKLQEYSRKINADVFFNNDTNFLFGIKRDIQARKLSNFKGFDNDAIIRDFNINTRSNWSEYCAKYFNSEILYCKLDQITKNNNPDEISFKEIIDNFNIRKTKRQVPIGGRNKALQRLEKFCDQISKYPKNISKPYYSELYTSRLSAYLSFGCLSTKEVYQRIDRIPGHSREKQFYISRIFWNQHFTQKLQDFPLAVEKPVNPFFEEKNPYSNDKKLQEKFFEGKTGYPLIDASVRALTSTGFINFRMRAMIASFFCHILKQDWKIGADWMHYHLIDADTAINYEQWQMQAGLIGVHPLRIYNPTKQILDNDKDLKFIHKYLKELQTVNDINLISEPWKNDKEIERKFSVIIGKDYPYPIVDFSEEAKITRQFFKDNKADIRKALGLPEIQTRASLSKKVSNSHKKKKKEKKDLNKKLDSYFK